MLKFDLKKAAPDKSKLVKNLAKGNVLVPYLDRAFNTFDGPFEFKYESKKTDDAWHPSGDCTPTVTELWHKAKGTGDEWVISGSLRKTFMVGHYWHQLLQHLVVDVLEMAPLESVERSGSKGWGPLKLVMEQEVLPVQQWHRPYHWVSGSADIAPLETKTWKGLVDFKTMSSHQFKQNSLPEWCAGKYKCQMNIYMDLFDLDKALIVGVNKDSPHDFKEYEFARDQNLIDAIYAKWEFVSELLDQDAEPSEADDIAFELPLGA